MKTLLVALICLLPSFMFSQNTDELEISTVYTRNSTDTLMVSTVYAQGFADTLGIFAVLDDGLVRMESISHSKIRTSGAIASMFTMGLSRTKSKLEFKGSTSPYHFKDIARFRFYFGTPIPEKVAQYYMFMGNYSIRDFGVAKFELKKGKRRLHGVTASILGTSIGVEEDETAKINYKEVHPNVYDVSIKAIPGEYCILFTGTGYAGFTGVFDFSIE